MSKGKSMVAQRPFRFSAIVKHATSRKEWISKARAVEDAGYTALLIPDHLHIGIDPAVALMMVADTTSLRVGSHVFNNDFRNPALLAKQVATLDMLSEGRFQLGLGCGYDQNDYRQIGVAFDEAGVRISRLEEAVRLIKKYCTEESLTFSGTYYQMQDVQALPKSAQKSHSCPPIFMGGSGRRMLSLAAREADIVGILPRGGPNSTQQKLAWIQEAAGARFDQLELSVTVFMVAVTQQRVQTAQQVIDGIGLTPLAAQKIASQFGMTLDDVLGHTPLMVGPISQMVETLQERRERYGISCIEVHEPYLETFAPVVAQLAGK